MMEREDKTFHTRRRRKEWEVGKKKREEGG